MLDLWRPPQGAGDPIGCLATTYTFEPGMFDEQCLARFLEIESEPDREDLAFLLERESRLGSVYAGVLVDYTRAGVEHSLRWDVLPVRIRAGKQHAKISLLAWSHHIRIIVASANLTGPGYRTNYEVAVAVDLTREQANSEILSEAVAFLRSLLILVPGASERPPEIQRAEEFLKQVEVQAQGWKKLRRGANIRQQLAYTLPAIGTDRAARSSIEDTIQVCRGRGGSPNEIWVASPFFDAESDNKHLTASLCKFMARGERRELWFCIPAIRDNEAPRKTRLAAPKTLLLTPAHYDASVNIEMLPAVDEEKNRRPWHAKMLGLFADSYSALMIGSSNFTCAGMGISEFRNAEANLVTIIDRLEYSREDGALRAVWPEMEQVDDPESAEWIGAQPDQDEEEQDSAPPLPAGFLSATYRAGDERQIVLRLDTSELPEEWTVRACGKDFRKLLCASAWHESGDPVVIEIAWEPVQPPEKLIVLWKNHEAFLPVNVEDSRKLPPPAQLENMSADDMLWILAATDPSAAFRAWAKRRQTSDLFDTDLDSATPIDLDPLRRYDLNATFLHRIRRRARILAQLRANLQRPVWGQQALEWRLRGLIGVEQLADRLVKELSHDAADEALLTLADFLIVLNEVDYQPSDGSLPKAEFEKTFRSFLRELAVKLRQQIEVYRDHLSNDLMEFWERVVERCQE
ncbi:hypothetical protein EH220_08120 [bacterium]|nr:MAG: hypothetical protein EH220_08120 [bacterium]